MAYQYLILALLLITPALAADYTADDGMIRFSALASAGAQGEAVERITVDFGDGTTEDARACPSKNCTEQSDGSWMASFTHDYGTPKTPVKNYTLIATAYYTDGTSEEYEQDISVCFRDCKEGQPLVREQRPGLFSNLMSNMCEALGARPTITCPQINNPVCDVNGMTHTNTCTAALAGADIAHAGACEKTPQACPQVFDPVCGVDGQTYSNSCVAASEKVEVDYSGACDDEPPEACPQVFDPVCGVDGETYGNSCEAAQAQVEVDYSGTCDDEPPQACPQVFDPVCGVDGETYSNSCVAASEEVEIDYDGQCEETPQACPQVFDPVCGVDGETYGNSCEAAKAEVEVDYSGECESAPEACPQTYNPVCGSDGDTYVNECEAAAAGVESTPGACD